MLNDRLSAIEELYISYIYFYYIIILNNYNLICVSQPSVIPSFPSLIHLLLLFSLFFLPSPLLPFLFSSFLLPFFFFFFPPIQV